MIDVATSRGVAGVCGQAPRRTEGRRSEGRTSHRKAYAIGGKEWVEMPLNRVDPEPDYLRGDRDASLSVAREQEMWDGGSTTRRPDRVSRRRDDDRGAAAIEFALIAPLLFMLVFAIIDFGFGIHAWDATHNAAREGARFGAVNPSTSQIEARVRRASDFLDQSVMSVNVQCAAEGSSSFGACGSGSSWVEGDVVRVTVSYQYNYMTPLPSMVGLGDTLLVRNVSEARFEGQ